MTIPISVYSFCARTNFIHFKEMGKNIRNFHATFFHGICARNRQEWPHDPVVWENTPDVSPLDVTRSGLFIPRVSNPGTFPIVDREIANAVCNLPGLKLSPIRFERLVGFYIEKGDMSWVDHWGQRDPDDVLRSLPDVSELHRGVGEYFEILCRRHQDIVQDFPDAPLSRLTVGSSPMDKNLDISLSSRLFRQFAMIWAGGDLLISDRLFALLDPFLDRDFFVVREFKLKA